MIVEDYRIAHRNVASKLYRFIPEEIELAINDFEKILSEQGYHMDGRMFFSILSDPTEEVIKSVVPGTARIILFHNTVPHMWGCPDRL